MEPDAALERTECRTELHAEPSIDANLALIVHPWDTKDDLPFRLAEPLYQGMVEIGRAFRDNVSDTFEHFPNSLVKLGFARIALQYIVENQFKFFVQLGQGEAPVHWRVELGKEETQAQKFVCVHPRSGRTCSCQIPQKP